MDWLAVKMKRGAEKIIWERYEKSCLRVRRFLYWY